MNSRFGDMIGWPTLTKVGACMAALAMSHTLAMAGECVKTARWSDDAPYAYRAPDGQIKGLNVELINAALAQLQCEVRWLELPWARALVELKEGRLDILPGARKTAERELFAHFSVAVNRSPNVLFLTQAAATKYPLHALEDIIGTDFKLGVQIGVAYSQAYDQLAQTAAFQQHLTPISSRRNGWKMLEIERIDAMISDEITAMVELKEMGLLTKIVPNKAISTGDPAQVMFSKATVQKVFVDAFNRTVQAMIADGRYRKIRETYVPCAVSADGIGCK